MRLRHGAFRLVAAVTFAVAAACGGEGADETADAGRIRRSWLLVAFGPAAELGDPEAAARIRDALADLPPESPITLGLEEEGRVAGFSGCNRYFGDFRIESGNRIEQGPKGATMMACPEPRMELERTFLGNLESATGFSLGAGGLELESEGGVRLSFAPQEGAE